MSRPRRSQRARPQKQYRPRREAPLDFFVNMDGHDPAQSLELRCNFENQMNDARIVYMATRNPVVLWGAMMPAGMLHRFWGAPWPTWMIDAMAGYGGRVRVLMEKLDPVDAVKELAYELGFTGHKYNAFLEAHQLRTTQEWLQEVEQRSPFETRKEAVGRIAARGKLSD